MDHISTPELTLALMFVGQLVVVALGYGALIERVKNLKDKVAELAGVPAAQADSKARIEALEADRALAQDLMATLSGLSATVKGLADRFTSLERKVEDLGRKEP